MDKPLGGKQIPIDIINEVNELFEQSDRQTRSRKRKDRRYLNFVENMDELDTLPMLPQADTAALVIKIDSYNRLYAAVDRLPELQRRRLLLYYFEGLNYRQIADSEGVSISAVASTVERALIALKKLLNE